MAVIGKRNFFYNKIAITATAFPSVAQFEFPFHSSKIIIINDATDDVALIFSFRLPHIDGELFCSDEAIIFDGLAEDRVYMKLSAAGSAQVRVWAWRS